MEIRLPFEVNNLCHLVEFLTGSMILARQRYDLHNITLPRGWLLHLLRQVKVKDAETFFLDRLLTSMKSILSVMILGGDLGSA